MFFCALVVTKLSDKTHDFTWMDGMDGQVNGDGWTDGWDGRTDGWKWLMTGLYTDHLSLTLVPQGMKIVLVLDDNILLTLLLLLTEPQN